jgi:hypothetical protein
MFFCEESEIFRFIFKVFSFYNSQFHRRCTMKLTTLVLLMSTALLSTAALADVPGLITYQGTLTDGDGVALDTIVSVTFSIYTDSTGGAQVWAETQPLVEVNHGLFNVLLGRVNAISDTVFNGVSRWLGVRVESDPELAPRQRMAAVGYAFRASVADTADFARAPAPSDGDWTISGNHMYSALPGSVSIWAMSPDAKLHVVGGNVAVSDAGDATGIKIAESWIKDPYDGALRIQSGGDVVAFDGSDDVCIGTTIPSGKLTVDGGNAIIKGGDGWDGSGDEARLYLGDYNHGVEAAYGQGLRVWTFEDTISDIRFGGHTGIDYMTIKMNSGKVGIGTLIPGAMLDVSGDVNTNSLYRIDGNMVLSTPGDNTHVGADAGVNDSGHYATLVGYNAGYHNSGTGCTFVGADAGYSNEGSYNTFVGAEAGIYHTWGTFDTFVGYQAGRLDTTGGHNTFVGAWAGEGNNGSDNTFLGYLSGNSNTSGYNNTFLGSCAGWDNKTGTHNTFVGTGAGQCNITGHSNTILGYDAGYYNTSGSNNVFLGYRAGYSETGSNKLYIANSYDTSSVLIYGDFSTGNVGIGTLSPSERLEVDGGIKLTTAWGNIYGENLKIWGSSNSDVLLQATTTGNVGIGTLSPGYKLDVDGDINTSGEVRQNGSAYLHPDYVFEPGYELMSLAELEDFVAAKKHLPGMPSAEEVKKDGVKLFEQNRLLVEKLEEAYLYIIELQERVAKLETVAEAKLTASR